ncbi:MAG: hypothetical protein FWJ90_07330 [Actinomadura sp.]
MGVVVNLVEGAFRGGLVQEAARRTRSMRKTRASPRSRHQPIRYQRCPTEAKATGSTSRSVSLPLLST